MFTEEMISSNNVMYFSPDGSQLAYAQFNDTQCDHIQFSRYDGLQYPNMIDVSYPKVSKDCNELIRDIHNSTRKTFARLRRQVFVFHVFVELYFQSVNGRCLKSWLIEQEVDHIWLVLLVS